MACKRNVYSVTKKKLIILTCLPFYIVLFLFSFVLKVSLVGINGLIMWNSFPAWVKKACLPNMTSPKDKNHLLVLVGRVFVNLENDYLFLIINDTSAVCFKL